MVVRGEKRTKEINEDELERLKNPEERPTSAIDPAELQSLVKAASLPRAPTDDLAIPVEPPPNMPRATPADVTKQARAATDVASPRARERISHQQLGVMTVEPPRGIAPLPKLVALADSVVPEPTRYPRASTRQQTLDETQPVRKGTSPLAMFLALAIPGILLALAYVVLIR